MLRWLVQDSSLALMELDMIERRPSDHNAQPCHAYRAYLVNPDGRFIGFVELFCSSDEEAVNQARLVSSEYAVELWRRDSKIAYIPNSSEPGTR